MTRKGQARDADIFEVAYITVQDECMVIIDEQIGNHIGSYAESIGHVVFNQSYETLTSPNVICLVLL